MNATLWTLLVIVLMPAWLFVGFILYFIGFIFFFGGFLLVGLVQGTNWVHAGLPVWTVLPAIRPYLALRAAGGAVLFTGFILFVINMFATMIARKPEVVVPSPLPVPQPRTGLQPSGSPAD